MAGHNEDTYYYYSNYWWINPKEDWLKITLIAAPLLIVCALVLITHRVCSTRTSRMYTPCSAPHAALYNPVYRPTTRAFEDTRCAMNNHDGEYVIMATDASVVGDAKKGNSNLLRCLHATKPQYRGFRLSDLRSCVSTEPERKVTAV